MEQPNASHTLIHLQLDEVNLLHRIRQGEREAIIAAYELYFAPLYQYVRLRVSDPAIAEDLVSDVFVKLIESIGTPSAPDTHLRGWLFRVARSALYHHHEQQRQVSLTDVEDWMTAPESNPETAAAELLDMQRVRRALNMLTDDHQEVLTLRFAQRLSLQETAALMGKSVSAIKSLQFRAVMTLRGILSDINPEVANG
jgi:RNA polymerase sigma-70 factor, ECF subfamily